MNALPRGGHNAWQRVGLAVVGLLIVACGPRSSEPNRPLSEHAVRSTQLRAIMARLGTQVRSEWPQDDADPAAVDQFMQDRQARFREAAQLAGRLGQAADLLPAAIADVPMAEPRRAEFLAIVELLRDESQKLGAAAAAHDMRHMKAALSTIKTTCYGCHAQFREVAGPIQFGDEP